LSAKKNIYIVLKLLIIILSYTYIVYRLKKYDPGEIEFPTAALNNINGILTLICVIMLMILNWGAESLKWKLLVSKLEPVSFAVSVKAILSGITVSIFTPNRIGMFLGRILVLSKVNRASAVFSTLAGSMSQLLITVIAGIAGTGLMIMVYPEKSFLGETNIYITGTLLFIFTGALIFLYLNISTLKIFLAIIPVVKKYEKYFRVLATYNTKELFIILLLSFFRYLVFVTQFCILLILYNVDITLFQAIISIAVTYFFMTFVPAITLFEAGVRGSVALFFIGIFSNGSIGILTAYLTLWIINLAIPAIMGSAIIYRIKI